MNSDNNNSRAKIVVKPDEAKEKFGAMISNMAIQMFVERDYEIVKNKLNDSYAKLDTREIKSIVHTLKTNARYMCAEEFALECQAIENCVKEGWENLPLLSEMYPGFMQDYDVLFEEATKAYNNLSDEEEEEEEEEEAPKETPAAKVEPVQKRESVSSEEPPKRQISQDQEAYDIHGRNSELVDVVHELPKPKQPFGLNSELRSLDKLKPSNYLIKPKPSSLISIDPQKIKIQKSEINSKFRESLKKGFLENGILSLNNELKAAFEANDCGKFKEALRHLKKISLEYNFIPIPFKVDEWLPEISKIASFQDLGITWDDIDQILTAMISEATKIAESPSIMKSELLLGRNLKGKVDDINKSPGNRSRNILIPNARVVTSPGINVIVKDEEQLFQELKPIKFEGLYKKDMTNEEIEAEIEWLNKDSQNETQSKGNRGVSKGGNSGIIDCSYPFKQESFTCSIL